MLPCLARCVVVAAVLMPMLVGSARGSVLTFDEFTNAAKTIRVPVGSTGSPPNQSYGDNISDFSPVAPVGGRYVNYGAAGGYTPNIAVAYRWYDTLDPTNPDPDHNGPGGSFGWNTGYGTLQHVIFSDADTLNRNRWLSEVQFTPEPGYRVTLSSLDFAGYQGAQSGQTLKIVADANSPSAQVLWSAGADGAVTFPAVAGTLSPLVKGLPGQTLSILWGYSDRSGLDNITFSQTVVPEATWTTALIFGGILVRTALMRRGTT